MNKARSKAFFIVLGCQILVGAAVGLLFSTIASRFVAGLIAGSLFIVLGAGVIFYGIRQAWFRRTGTFFLAGIHIGVISIPMVVSRLLNPDVAFEAVSIWGLPGPQFHALSTRFYSVWMAVVLLEGVWRLLRARKRD